MYNSAGASAAGTGTILAMAGMSDYLTWFTGIAFLLIAVIGIIMLYGSRESQKNITKELR